jgi:O-antigen/teichoic acid export membrane protein
LGREGWTATFDVARKALTVGVGIALVAATELGVAGMLVGHVAANLVVALAAGVVLLRAVGLGSLARPRVGGLPWRELVSFNLLNVVLVVLVRSMAHVDVVMLRAFTDPSTTGFYKAALSTAEYIWLVPMALQAALLHSSSSLWNEDRTDEITAIATRVTRYTLLLVVLMALGMAVLVDRFVPLYFGGEFAASVVPLLVLLPGVVGFAAARPLQAISQGSGRLRTLLYAVGGAAGLNLALNALLIPQFGMIGAATATSVGYASMFGFLVWAAYRLGFDPLADLRAGRIAATAVLTAPVVWGVDRVVAGALVAAPARWGVVDGAANAVVALAVVPPVGLLAFLAVAVQVGALDIEELQSIAEKAPGPVSGSLRTALSWVD